MFAFQECFAAENSMNLNRPIVSYEGCRRIERFPFFRKKIRAAPGKSNGK